MLSPAIRTALVADLSLNAVAAIAGPEHTVLHLAPGVQFAALVTAGIVVEEIGAMMHTLTKLVQRWRQVRARRLRSRRKRAAKPSRSNSVPS